MGKKPPYFPEDKGIVIRTNDGHALMYPGPDGRTAYRNGYPVGIVNDTNPDSCDGTCKAQCTICDPDLARSFTR